MLKMSIILCSENDRKQLESIEEIENELKD